MTSAASTITVALVVNGERRTCRVEARASLADVLRDRLGLTGTHLGCEQGVCGSCTVLVNGVSTRSCLFLAAQADGCDVVTVEGLSPERGCSPLQQAIADAGGLQCGFCTPGFVVAITELLEAPDFAELDEHAIREELSGNICRCTGYQGLIEAVRRLQHEEEPQ